jgi:hypothetical protein
MCHPGIGKSELDTAMTGSRPVRIQLAIDEMIAGVGEIASDLDPRGSLKHRRQSRLWESNSSGQPSRPT